MKLYLIYLSIIFRVIQQPAGEFLYFSLDPFHMTQSQAPKQVCPGAASDNFMLLIESSPVVHNMQVGQRFYMESRNGEREYYVIYSIDKFLAPGGANPWGNFILESDGKERTAYQTFILAYCNPLWKVNIQTCYDGLNRMIVHAVTIQKWNQLSKMW